MNKAILNFSDQELIEMLKKEHFSNAAVSALYRNHYMILSNYIKQNQGSEQDSEDIFQEVIVTFIEVVKNDKFRGESTIRTFLYSLMRYTWLNELKRRNRTLLREEKYGMGVEGDEKDVSHFIIERESKKLVITMIERLGDTCKKILTAYYYDRLSMKEILPLVNYENEQVLRNKKYKCLKSLEQMLAANPGLAKRFKNALGYE